MTTSLTQHSQPKRDETSGRVFHDVMLIDYSNHPFLKRGVEQLRELGHDVSYMYSSSFQGPNMASSAEGYKQSDWLIGISLDEEFAKYSWLKRRSQEIEWARRCTQELDRIQPAVVLVANTPLDVMRKIDKWCKANDSKMVFWIQDFYGIASRRILSERMGRPGDLIGRFYERIERRLVKSADHLVLISGAHLDMVEQMGAPRSKCTVLENWAIIDDYPIADRDNHWAADQGVDETINLIYSGTLGLKHNPDLLSGLARGLSDVPQARVIVISEGVGADVLAETKAAQGLDNLVLLPFQPYEWLPEVLGSADVLIALLTYDAGDFSVPSKVLSYLCAGRPIVGSIPRSNLAAQIIEREDAGTCVNPEDEQGFLDAVRQMVSMPAQERAALGRNARTYAERTFSAPAVTGRLIGLLNKVGAPTRSTRTI
ncbi:MAG: glycosyltransferase family 4 protein [Acidimicrobiia bacterium]|jgi:glycosyltransferase involved in cell wall biosynthesis|nr:glycosyltransferase family 4 protein [Acidimicrobiia bacterium]MBP8180086.1 glycosyltransferase family 4 protein [Acidimicrobiia bacterium]